MFSVSFAFSWEIRIQSAETSHAPPSSVDVKTGVVVVVACVSVYTGVQTDWTEGRMWNRQVPLSTYSVFVTLLVPPGTTVSTAALVYLQLHFSHEALLKCFSSSQLPLNQHGLSRPFNLPKKRKNTVSECCLESFNCSVILPGSTIKNQFIAVPVLNHAIRLSPSLGLSSQAVISDSIFAAI